MHKNFNVDKFHLKPKNIKNLEHFTLGKLYMKYMLNAYITVCECINILAIYNVISGSACDMLSLINYKWEMHKQFSCRQISFKTKKYKKILNISQKIPPFLKISKNTGTTPLYWCFQPDQMGVNFENKICTKIAQKLYTNWINIYLCFDKWYLKTIVLCIATIYTRNLMRNA
jgi:hypothetical protein